MLESNQAGHPAETNCSHMCFWANGKMLHGRSSLSYGAWGAEKGVEYIWDDRGRSGKAGMLGMLVRSGRLSGSWAVCPVGKGISRPLLYWSGWPVVTSLMFGGCPLPPRSGLLMPGKYAWDGWLAIASKSVDIPVDRPASTHTCQAVKLWSDLKQSAAAGDCCISGLIEAAERCL